MENDITGPVVVTLPNTVKEKMAAIVALSEAVKNVSKALVSVSVEVTIANNTINGAETGIKIETEKV